MAKITELPVAAQLSPTDTVPAVQGGVTKRTTMAAISAAVVASPEIQAAVPGQTGPEANAGAIYRLRWGMREIARFSKTLGWQFQRLLLRASDTRLDDSVLLPLLKDRIGTPTGPEVGAFWRLVVGNRLFADVTLLRGFYPRRMTIPASAKVDDDLNTALGDRLNGVINGGKSGPAISMFGDSLTAGAGGTPTSVALATLTGRTVNNLGVGGETSREIFGRAGTTPLLVTVTGGSIPASGGVTVTLASSDSTSAVSVLNQGEAGLNPCSVAGVLGILTKAGGVYTFTRSTAGVAVPVPFARPLITDAFNVRRGDIAILETVQNGTDDIEAIIPRINAYLRSMTRPLNLWLVAGWTSDSLANRAVGHTRLQKEYGRRFVNNLAWLSSSAALANAGITPTQADLDAIAAGTLPPSFWSTPTDPVHMNTAGYAQKAYFEHQRMIELGWL